MALRAGGAVHGAVAAAGDRLGRRGPVVHGLKHVDLARQVRPQVGLRVVEERVDERVLLEIVLVMPLHLALERRDIAQVLYQGLGLVVLQDHVGPGPFRGVGGHVERLRGRLVADDVDEVPHEDVCGHLREHDEELRQAGQQPCPEELPREAELAQGDHDPRDAAELADVVLDGPLEAGQQHAVGLQLQVDVRQGRGVARQQREVHVRPAGRRRGVELRGRVQDVHAGGLLKAAA
mmetsp:Transcript_103307/g.333222  ORF Transcript_103307/g.333222 Transcript_103307/m.333222 type:complete len:235 (-) Transcript_103307:189-893(-)